MKKLFTLSLVALATLTFVGCSSQPVTPADVVKEFLTLYNNGEVEDAMEYVCYTEEDEHLKDTYAKTTQKRYDEARKGNEYEVLSIKTTEDLNYEGYAIVSYELEQKLNGEVYVETQEVNLIETKDGWRIAFRDIQE